MRQGCTVRQDKTRSNTILHHPSHPPITRSQGCLAARGEVNEASLSLAKSSADSRAGKGRRGEPKGLWRSVGEIAPADKRLEANSKPFFWLGQPRKCCSVALF